MDSVILWACVDCVQFVAGTSEEERGEPYPPAVHAAMARIVVDNAPELRLLTVVSVDEDDEDPAELEQHFSWNRCECCLSALGGDRYPIELTVGV